jgi:hypothetical protein
MEIFIPSYLQWSQYESIKKCKSIRKIIKRNESSEDAYRHGDVHQHMEENKHSQDPRVLRLLLQLGLGQTSGHKDGGNFKK